MEKINYTTILHPIRIELGLTNNEYCIADSIYHLSNNLKSPILGWCYATKENLGKYIGISKQATLEIIKNLITKKILIKDEETKYLKTSEKWYDNVVVKKVARGKESLPESVKKVAKVGKESLPYNNSNNNIDIISKDITANAENNLVINGELKEKPKPKSYGRQDINNIIGYLSAKVGGSLDGTIKANRNCAMHLINKVKKETEDYENEIIKVINRGSADDWHGNKLTSMYYLNKYWQTLKLLNKQKGNRTVVDDPSIYGKKRTIIEIKQ